MPLLNARLFGASQANGNQNSPELGYLVWTEIVLADIYADHCGVALLSGHDMCSSD